MGLKFTVPELKTAIDMAIEVGTSTCDLTRRDATRKAATAATVVRGVSTEVRVQLTQTDRLIEGNRAKKMRERGMCECGQDSCHSCNPAGAQAEGEHTPGLAG